MLLHEIMFIFCCDKICKNLTNEKKERENLYEKK